MLQYSAGFHPLIASKSEQVIPLPYWNLILWKSLPVFHFIVDGRDYAYTTPVNSLLVESTFASLAEPISAETVLKLQTYLPFENLQKNLLLKWFGRDGSKRGLNYLSLNVL